LARDLGNSTLSGSVFFAKESVGDGHKRRALAHGYSIFTPSRFKTWCSTPGVQLKIWVKISPSEEGSLGLNHDYAKTIGAHRAAVKHVGIDVPRPGIGMDDLVKRLPGVTAAEDGDRSTGAPTRYLGAE
jgi:hypothetical protein